MAVLRLTRAPAPPSVEALICAFAHGSCVCEAAGAEACTAVRVAAERIRNRVQLDLAAERRDGRKGAA
jgi:hypothetical protein